MNTTTQRFSRRAGETVKDVYYASAIEKPRPAIPDALIDAVCWVCSVGFLALIFAIPRWL